MTGCVQGVKTEVVQHAEFSYLKFTGNRDSVSVIIDEGQYNFDLFKSTSYGGSQDVAPNKKETLFKIDTGKHRIQIYRNNNLIMDRMIFLENHVTTEINIP